MTISAANDRKLRALTVFSLVLKFLKDHALRELGDVSGRVVLADDVRWVVTIPAIWRSSAKQFMRQAAYEVPTLYIVVH